MSSFLLSFFLNFEKKNSFKICDKPSYKILTGSQPTKDLDQFG